MKGTLKLIKKGLCHGEQEKLGFPLENRIGAGASGGRRALLEERRGGGNSGFTNRELS